MIWNCNPLATKMATRISSKCSESARIRAASQTATYLDYGGNFSSVNHGAAKSRNHAQAIRDQKHTPFLVEGYQPTTAELASWDDVGYRRGRKGSNAGRVLPILDAAVIL